MGLGLIILEPDNGFCLLQGTKEVMGPDEDLVSLVKPSPGLYGDQEWLQRVTKTGFPAVKEELQRGTLL